MVLCYWTQVNHLAFLHPIHSMFVQHSLQPRLNRETLFSACESFCPVLSHFLFTKTLLSQQHFTSSPRVLGFPHTCQFSKIPAEDPTI